MLSQAGQERETGQVGFGLGNCDEGFVFPMKEKWGAAVKSENLMTYRYRAKKRQEAIVTGFKPGKGWHRSQSNFVSH